MCVCTYKDGFLREQMVAAHANYGIDKHKIEQNRYQCKKLQTDRR